MKSRATPLTCGSLSPSREEGRGEGASNDLSFTWRLTALVWLLALAVLAPGCAAPRRDTATAASSPQEPRPRTPACFPDEGKGVRRAGEAEALRFRAAPGGAPPDESTPERRFEFSRPEMGVPFRMVLYASDPATAETAARAAFDRVRQLNGLFTEYDSDSELSRLCQTHRQAVPLSDELWQVLVRAQELARQSDGAFDVTVGPLVNLWRRARRLKQLPDPAWLAEARAAVGYEKLRLDPRRRTAELRAPNMRLTLGGIAKGYAVDQALAVLRRHGISRALVAGSGDIAVSDPPPGRPGWRIELERPQASHAPPARFLLLARAAVATSGDLFQHVEIGGRRYSHIVNPRTGLGLTDRGLVTVIAPDCTTADGLATAVSVLGPERGLKLVRRTPGAAARIIRQPGAALEVRESPRFRTYYDPAAPP